MVDLGSVVSLRFVSVAILFFALSSTLMFSVSATGDQEVSVSIISEAEQSMARAYEAVLDAERGGAEVSDLVAMLNDGAALLSQAGMAFEVGDFEEATRFAESTSEIGAEVADEAELLETEADNAQVEKSWWFLTASALGISTVIVASLLGYQYFKRRYYRRLSEKSRVGQPNFQDYRTLFQVGSLVFVLLAASPALSLVVSFPKGGESFSEFWILGPNHTAEDYPFSVRAGEMCSVFVGVGNHMGRPEYYMVYIKFGNSTQLDFEGSKPSSLPPLYEFRVFASDEDVWESPVTLEFQNVSITDNVLFVDNVIIDGLVFPFDVSTSWNSENNGFLFRLSFELWHYDMVLKSFRFHDRIVGLWLNMTGS